MPKTSDVQSDAIALIAMHAMLRFGTRSKAWMRTTCRSVWWQGNAMVHQANTHADVRQTSTVQCQMPPSRWPGEKIAIILIRPAQHDTLHWEQLPHKKHRKWSRWFGFVVSWQAKGKTTHFVYGMSIPKPSTVQRSWPHCCSSRFTEERGLLSSEQLSPSLLSQAWELELSDLEICSELCDKDTDSKLFCLRTTLCFLTGVADPQSTAKPTCRAHILNLYGKLVMKLRSKKENGPEKK
jgi:hypothetical protein